MAGVSRFDCYPSDALNGMVGMTADEIAVYWVVMLLQYDRGEPVQMVGRERELIIRSGLSKGRFSTAVDLLLAKDKLCLANGCLFNSRTQRELEKISSRICKNRESSAEGGRRTKEIWDENSAKIFENIPKISENVAKISDDGSCHLKVGGEKSLDINDTMRPVGLPNGKPTGPVSRRGPPSAFSHPPKEEDSSLRSLVSSRHADARKSAAEAFPRFWAAYPRRAGTNPRHPAEQKFVTLVLGGVDPEAIIAGATAYAGFKAADDPQFVKQAVVWLNQRMWQDDYSATPGIRAPPVNGRQPTRIDILAEIQRNAAQAILDERACDPNPTLDLSGTAKPRVG